MQKMQVLVPVLSLASCVTHPLSEPLFPSSVQLLLTLVALKVYNSMDNVCNHEFLSYIQDSESIAGLSPKKGNGRKYRNFFLYIYLILFKYLRSRLVQ